MDDIIAWRLMKGLINPPDVLTLKDSIYEEGPECKQTIYNRLNVAAESLNDGVKNRLAQSRFT